MGERGEPWRERWVGELWGGAEAERVAARIWIVRYIRGCVFMIIKCLFKKIIALFVLPELSPHSSITVCWGPSIPWTNRL